MCPKRTPGVCENQGKAVGALELELGMAVNQHACTGNQTQVLSKSNTCP